MKPHKPYEFFLPQVLIKPILEMRKQKNTKSLGKSERASSHKKEAPDSHPQDQPATQNILVTAWR